MHLKSLSPPKITHKLDIIQIINDIMNIILFVFFIITLTVYYAMKYIKLMNNDIFIFFLFILLTCFCGFLMINYLNIKV